MRLPDPVMTFYAAGIPAPLDTNDNWGGSAAVAGAFISAFWLLSANSSMSTPQVAGSPDVFAIIAAGWGIIFACSVCVLFITSYIYFYLSRNDA